MAVSVERRKFIDAAIKKLSEDIYREMYSDSLKDCYTGVHLSTEVILHVAEYELDYLANSSPRYYANTERLLKEKSLDYILDAITPRVLSSNVLHLEIEILRMFEEDCGGCDTCVDDIVIARKEAYLDMSDEMKARRLQTVQESENHQLTLQGV